jgi:hypothetical protein
LREETAGNPLYASQPVRHWMELGRAARAREHPETGLPEGQRSHTSGPCEGGYLISVLWDSKEQSAAFMQNTVLPALPVKGGFAGAPEEHAAQVAHHDEI